MRDRCLPFEGCHGFGYHTDYTDSGSGATVWCGCAASYCLSVGFFDAGRGDESFACMKRPGHEGDHGVEGITWRDNGNVL